MLLALNNVSASYDGVSVLDGLSLELHSGEIGCLLGPSGCGKTTALRCIAGFESLQSGSISLGPEIVSDQHKHIPPEKRDVGVVFQDYALLPHLTVMKNVTLALHRWDKNKASQRSIDILETVGLSHCRESYPHQLSGGEQQRVALARALAPNPKLLLMDEPFSNLDAELRAKLSHEVRQLIKDLGITTLLVTHDQDEAFTVADRVAVLHKGCIQQYATPAELYHQPANAFVAGFIGAGRLVPGDITDQGTVSTLLGRHPIRGAHKPVGQAVQVLFRPEDLAVSPESSCRAKVTRSVFRGNRILVWVTTEQGQELICQTSPSNNILTGEDVGIQWIGDSVVVL